MTSNGVRRAETTFGSTSEDYEQRAASDGYERQVETPTGDYERRLLQATSGNFERRATNYDCNKQGLVRAESDNYERQVTTTSRKQRVETPTSDERRATPLRYK